MYQTDVLYIPGFKYMYEAKGSKQVNIISKDEKHGFTLCISSTPAGDFLLIQQVCGGKTMQSLPDLNVEDMDKALSLGCHFTIATSEKNPSSHYSTLNTIKQYMDSIFKPHYDRMLSDDPSLPQNQRAVLYLDAYPVHISEAFLKFLHEKYPYVLPIFVPANCTGIFQPVDVGLQRVIKHNIKQVFLEELVRSQHQQLASGTELENVEFSNSITVLRNVSVKAIVGVFDYMSSSAGQKIIKMAWHRCAVKKYNLSENMLLDHNIRVNELDIYLDADSILFKEITKCKKLQIIITSDIKGEAVNEAYNDTNEDDSSTPLSSIVTDTFKICIPNRCGRYCTHPEKVKNSETSTGLVPSAIEEDIFAYNADGNAWGEANLPTMHDN